MRRVLGLVLLIAVAITVVFSASGCGLIAQKATEGAIESATGGKVDVKGDSVTIKGENGEEATISNETEIPKDFPSSVPLADDGTVSAVMSNKTDKGTSYIVAIKYKTPVADLTEWYTTELAKDPWKTTSTVTTEDGAMITADDGETQVTVVISKSTEDGFTSEANMSVGPKPAQ